MKKILVVGDSHSKIWRYINEHNLMPGINYVVKQVAGATSQGINNPNSKTNALPIFKKAIAENNNSDFIMISLGEVDCGFTIWYYAEQFNISVDEQLDRSVSSYETFLNDVVKQHYRPTQIILLGSVLPTLQDQSKIKLLKGARAKVNTPLKDRTDLTLKYNSILKNLASQHGAHYIDITEATLNPLTSCIKKEFLNPIVHTHYLNSVTSAPEWVKVITPIILP